MALDSSEAGYLAPIAADAYDNALDQVLHDVIVGITGITGDLVRPRWQAEPPQQPSFDTNWCAFGITRVLADTHAREKQTAAGGPLTVRRDELLYVLHSFYGPSCHALCMRFREGLQVSQNRDGLSAANIALVEVQDALNLPALLKEKWVKRIDTTVVYRRHTLNTYPVLTITEGDMGLNNERYVTPIIVSNT